MAVNIYIHQENNPLYNHLLSTLEAGGYTIVTDPGSAVLMVAFAYHDKDDILEMNNMNELRNQFPQMKMIFLSWFHPLNDIDRYSKLFSPEAPTCILMDADKYRILQLPVNARELCHEVSSLIN